MEFKHLIALVISTETKEFLKKLPETAKFNLWSICECANSSVIRQKSKSQNGCFNKAKHAKFSEKRTFFTPWYAHISVRMRGGGGGCKTFSFFRKIWRVLISWNTRFEIRPSVLLPTNCHFLSLIYWHISK